MVYKVAWFGIGNNSLAANLAAALDRYKNDKVDHVAVWPAQLPLARQVLGGRVKVIGNVGCHDCAVLVALRPE